MTPLLSIDQLRVAFDGPDGGPAVQAVAGATMTVHAGQTLAVVGESGCGKSVTAMSVLQLVPRPPARTAGSIRFEGRDLLALREKEMLSIRGGSIAMIFQEPMTSLNPVYTIGDQIVEAVLLHQRVDRREARAIAVQSLANVGIEDPAARFDDYPHQFSGGMRQRVMIAMALACRPKLLLADEPTTALDVTIQAQILELLRGLQRERGMAMMLITHNLGVVAENADVVCVMYGGRVVEYANVLELFEHPMHPYTRGLLASIPGLARRREVLPTVRDVVEDPSQFTRLPGAERGVVPWWPGQPPPATLASRPQKEQARGNSVGWESAGWDSCLHEVSPDHWVGCWRTEELARAPSRRPDISWRRWD